MPQDTQTRGREPQRKKQSTLPGIGLSTAIAVLSGTVCWFWLGSSRANPPDTATQATSVLAEVQTPDVEGALTTMMLTNARRAEFRQANEGGCRVLRLAWVSLATPPGEPPSHIRLISGPYVSPVVEVSATPVRVALPYPAPYEAGHGLLTAINVGGSAAISLLPTWRVSAQEGRVTRAVSWNPVKNCSRSNG